MQKGLIVNVGCVGCGLQMLYDPQQRTLTCPNEACSDRGILYLAPTVQLEEIGRATFAESEAKK